MTDEIETTEGEINTEDESSSWFDKKSIWIYFKDHPAVMIACVSAIVAIISFFINATIYVSMCRFLHYWDIDKLYLRSNSINSVYSIAVTLLYCIVNMLIQRINSKSFDTYMKSSELLRISRKFNHIYLKQIRKGRKTLITLKKQYACAQKKSKSANKNLGLYSDINELENELCDMRERILASSEKTKKLNLYCLGRLFRNLIIVFVISIICFMSFFVFTNINTDFKIIFLQAFGYSIGTTVITFFTAFAFSPKISKKDIQSAIHAKDAEFNAIIDKLPTPNDVEYPIDIIVKRGTNILFSNGMLSSMLVYLLVSILLICFLIPFSSEWTSNKKQFMVYNENSIDYVIIYENANTFYLEEASIDERTIEIYSHKQRIIVSNDLSYEIMDFDYVEKVSEKQNVS